MHLFHLQETRHMINSEQVTARLYQDEIIPKPLTDGLSALSFSLNSLVLNNSLYQKGSNDLLLKVST